MTEALLIGKLCTCTSCLVEAEISSFQECPDCGLNLCAECGENQFLICDVCDALMCSDCVAQIIEPEKKGQLGFHFCKNCKD